MRARPFDRTAAACLAFACLAASTSAQESPAGRATNRLVVSPQGPRDGGDFGPHTPGTKTSGLQEAFDAAKARGMDLYVAGGNWTEGGAGAVVYNLHEPLRIPWMQNARVDGGHAVLNYTRKEGDAVVFDSQMSGAFRFGLIVSAADGAVVRIKPTTAGPDRFRVVTSTEFVFNALVGGGGAWPGGEPHKSDLDEARRWVGTGLWLDGSEGSIDANKITVLETVGCGVGLQLSGAVSRNTIEEVNIHLGEAHVRVGGPDDPKPADNRIEAFMDCQGVKTASGAAVFGSRNMLTLSARPFPVGPDLTFGEKAAGNLAIFHSPYRLVDRAPPGANHVLGVPAAGK
ncbi:hypothetical protein [Paludisphaera mucosa]|uniref:Right handed beta helix domain-containing protein n=1 Tax=Paludisphaera mucosa TaxID=3030827 RepID=A0ABT6FAH9_9BACT|nr:hypothetical protein [Paludisphaera mucosa]MDG3004587.1 hypothetical protein [Paludisphaera mucosa]